MVRCCACARWHGPTAPALREVAFDGSRWRSRDFHDLTVRQALLDRRVTRVRAGDGPLFIGILLAHYARDPKVREAARASARTTKAPSRAEWGDRIPALKPNRDKISCPRCKHTITMQMKPAYRRAEVARRTGATWIPCCDHSFRPAT